jgi:hypothetical protein
MAGYDALCLVENIFNDHAAAPKQFGICLSDELMELLSGIKKFG